MSKRFALISDLHLRNHARHDEYKEYFQIIKNILKEKQPDFVIFGGDLAHSKTNLSPDYFQLAYEFLNILQVYDYTKVIIIPGNHDCAERNLEKLDAISPLMKHFENRQYGGQSSYYYLKESDKDVKFDNYVFRSYSILDRNNWKYDRHNLQQSDILIGLFHGPLKGAKTDLGYIFDHAEEVNKFECCDFLWCGDIHSHYAYNDSESFISIGNPIQQDFGEKLNKGIVIYDIQDRTIFNKEWIQIPTLYPYVTLNINEFDDTIISNLHSNTRIKIVSDQSSAKTQEFIQYIKSKIKDNKPKSLIVVNKINKQQDSLSLSQSSNNLSFNEYVSDYKNKNGLIKLHSEYLKIIDFKDNTSNWKIKELSWNNLFSYGSNMTINFDKFENKSLGIFGANYSGKTSLIDVICFSVFGGWTKPFVKNINFINDKETIATCLVTLEVNKKLYSIFRKLEKVKKGKKIDCINTIEFKCLTDDTNLNGDTLPETQKNICELVGSMDDFLLTSISTQFNNFSLIDEKNTKRKQFFSRILGIDVYELIALKVKEDLKLLELQLATANKDSDYSSTECVNIIETRTKENEELSSYQHLGCWLQDIDINTQVQDEIKTELEIELKKKQEKEFLISEQSKKEKKKSLLMSEIQILLEKIGNVIDFDVNKYLEIKEKIQKLENELYLRNSSIDNLLKGIDKTKESVKLLETVPCEDKFPSCKFLVNAINAKKLLPILEEELIVAQKTKKEIEETKNTLTIELSSLNEQHKLYKHHIDSSKQLEKKKIELETIQNEDLDDRISKIVFSEDKIVSLKQKQQTLWESRAQIDSKINEIRQKIAENNKEIEIYTKLLKKIQEKEQLQQKLRRQYDLLSEYSNIVGKNGIIMHILSNFVPAISQMMNEIISNLADFTVEIKIEDDKNLEIYLTDEISTRLIETTSGSQKTIVSYALRLALMNYSQLCGCNLFILDEPGTALDKDHLIQFTKLLDMIKSIDKTIILVTHIDTLKDCVDVQFTVEKRNGYSKILS